MPSPFPGMNPYLEQEDVWHDFHQRFATAVAEALGPQVFPSYIVKIDEHIFIHEPPAEQRQLLGRPDTFLAPSGREGSTPAGAGVLEAPVRFVLPAVDEERQPFVEIRDRQSRQVITVIELLSPSNKDPGPDRVQYLGKRGEILRSR